MNLFDVIANSNAPLTAIREQMEIAIINHDQPLFDYLLGRYSQHPLDQQFWKEKWEHGNPTTF